MARPTEPGYYWLKDGEGWVIVAVGLSCFDALEIVQFCGVEDYAKVSWYSDDQWGGKITQEPVTDPPPPF